MPAETRRRPGPRRLRARSSSVTTAKPAARARRSVSDEAAAHSNGGPAGQRCAASSMTAATARPEPSPIVSPVSNRSTAARAAAARAAAARAAAAALLPAEATEGSSSVVIVSSHLQPSPSPQHPHRVVGLVASAAIGLDRGHDSPRLAPAGAKRLAEFPGGASRYFHLCRGSGAIGQAPTGHAPRRLCTTRSINLMPTNGRITPPRP